MRSGCSPAWRLKEGLELVLGWRISGEVIGKRPLKSGVRGGFGCLMAGGLALALDFGGLVLFGILV